MRGFLLLLAWLYMVGSYSFSLSLLLHSFVLTVRVVITCHIVCTRKLTKTYIERIERGEERKRKEKGYVTYSLFPLFAYLALHRRLLLRVHRRRHVHDVDWLIWHVRAHQLLLHHRGIHLFRRRLRASQADLNAGVPDGVALQRDHCVQRVLLVLKEHKAIAAAQAGVLVVLQRAGDDAAVRGKKVQQILLGVVLREAGNVHVAAERGRVRHGGKDGEGLRKGGIRCPGVRGELGREREGGETVGEARLTCAFVLFRGRKEAKEEEWRKSCVHQNQEDRWR